MSDAPKPVTGFWQYVGLLFRHTGGKLQTAWPKHLGGLVVAAGLPGIVTFLLTNDRKGAKTTFYVAAVVGAIAFAYELVYVFFVAGRDVLDEERLRADRSEAELRIARAELADASSREARPWLRAEYYDEWFDDEEEDRGLYNRQGLRFHNYGTATAIDITFEPIPLSGDEVIKPSPLPLGDLPPGQSIDMPLFIASAFAKIAKAIRLEQHETVQLMLTVRYWGAGPRVAQFTTEHALVWRSQKLHAHVIKPDEHFAWTDLTGLTGDLLA